MFIKHVENISIKISVIYHGVYLMIDVKLKKYTMMDNSQYYIIIGWM